MKKIALLSLLLFICLYTSAQSINVDSIKNTPAYKNRYKSSFSQSDYMYSVGFRIFSLVQLPKILNQMNYTDFHSSYLNGIMFKFNDNQLSYRVSGNYYNKNISFINQCLDCEIVTGKIIDYSAKLGFEKNINYAVIQPHFGLDIGFRDNRFTGSSESGSANYSAPYDVTAEKNSVVFTPFLGVKLNVADHLTFGAEASFDMLYSYERQYRTFKDASRSVNLQRYNKWEYLINPISMFTLQYNFGSTF